jgi:ATP-dependent helicase/nuclease subunit B
MSVQLLLAPAGGGKTAHAISRIRELRARDGLADPVEGLFAPVWVVLPNFPQTAAFRRRLARTGGALGVEVGTFYRLYADVLARAGTPAPRLFGPVQYRLLRAVVDRLCEEGRLQYYAPLRDKPGFVRALRTLIRELKRARVRRDDFTAAVADQSPRLAELAAVYAAYQDWLVPSGWTDAEGQAWLATRALAHAPDLYTDLALLVVDGFDEFNPTQLEVLRSLAGRAAETLITLTGDASTTDVPSALSTGAANPGRTTHRRFARARAALTAALPNLKPEALKPETAGPDSILRSLEHRLFEPLSPAPLPANGSVAFIEAQDRRQEVRAALRWLKARIVHDGMDADEVALLARGLDPYLPFLEETAAEFGMVLHLAVGSDLASNPAIAALLSALSLPVLDWPRRPVIEALASPYLDWPTLLAETAPEGVVGRLDAVARAGLVIQGLYQWHEALDQLALSVDGASAAKGVGAAGEEEDVASSDLPAGEEAATLRRAFERFVERLTPEPQAAVRDYVAWVEGIIGDDPALAVPSSEPRDDGSLRMVARVREAEGEASARPFARRDIAALQAFKDVLRGLVLSESLLEERPFPIPYARFFSELHGAVEAATYTLSPPEEAGRESWSGSILVAPVLRARGLSFRAVALLGLSEGEFPATEWEDPFLRESDRAFLRERGLVLEPRLRGEEVTLFYEAVTRARERLLLCRPYLADDGQAWGPSPYWRHVQRLVDGGPVRRIRPAELSLEEAASPQEFLTATAQAGLSTVPVKDGGPIDQGWRAALAGAEVVRARLARSPVGPHEGDLGPLAATLALRYGPTHVWSSSRLETYAKCALHFYVAHVLHLEPRTLPQEGFDRLILGSIYHQVLEEVYCLSPSEPLSVLAEVAQQVFAAAPEAYGFRPTPLWEQQQREFLRVLEKNVVALEEARAGYEPYAQEPPFGLHGYPPLTLPQPTPGNEQPPALSIQHPVSNIQCPISSIKIRGYIDRVDRAPDGSLRVIDYKAGSSRISACELEEGTRLQLPLYALAVQDALGLGPVVDGFYWHVGSASPSYLRLERYEGGVEGAAEAVVGYVRAYVGAVREGRFAPTPPSGGCPDHCPAVGFCWRYVARGW